MAEESESVPMKRWRCNAKEEALLIQCAELVLPYLTPSELANFSSIVPSLSDAPPTLPEPSRLIRSHFSTTSTPTPTRTSYTLAPSSSLTSPGGSSVISPSAPTRLRAESVGFVDPSGCDCEASAGPACPCAGLDGQDDVGREYGPGCRCGPDCGNRLTRNGLAVKVKIVRDEKKKDGD